MRWGGCGGAWVGGWVGGGWVEGGQVGWVPRGGRRVGGGRQGARGHGRVLGGWGGWGGLAWAWTSAHRLGGAGLGVGAVRVKHVVMIGWGKLVDSVIHHVTARRGRREGGREGGVVCVSGWGGVGRGVQRARRAHSRLQARATSTRTYARTHAQRHARPHAQRHARPHAQRHARLDAQRHARAPYADGVGDVASPDGSPCHLVLCPWEGKEHEDGGGQHLHADQPVLDVHACAWERVCGVFVGGGVGVCARG